MKPRRHVRMFKPRFALLVQAGTKLSTIRPTPKREIRAGDVLDLRQWKGLPYRSKQRKLREAICTRVTPIRISLRGSVLIVWLGRKLLFETELEQLAQRDGFASAQEMFDWFEAEHGLPFAGVLIQWQP